MTTCLVSIILLIASIYVSSNIPCIESIHISGKESVECYDCNYTPSGDIRGKYGWISSEQAGYPKCALTTKDDTYRVDKISCSSGVCFIRIDQNGLLYRGCADYSYLPWTVDIRLQCHYQGPYNTLWWFCNSTLCNDGLIDSRDRCDYRTHDSLQAVDRTPVPARKLSIKHGKELESPDESEIDYRGTLADDVEDKDHGDDAQHLEEGPVARELSGHQMVNKLNRAQVDYIVPDRHDSARNIRANPCDGTCRENTSGLFAHPNSSSYFIHCGHGNIDGQKCFCCQPFVVMCPQQTIFDDTYKICRRMPY